MNNNKYSFVEQLSWLQQADFQQELPNIQHGVERETLRVNKDGSIATDPHPSALGSALTHDLITTDFSESLLEFITPPESNYYTSLEQLMDIHKFSCESIGDQVLWPMSMPCFINSQTDIPIARYGDSNIAQMKEVYRTGLHNRYGSMMQVIAGVHFNFSLPDSFWQLWCEKHNEKLTKYTRSFHYFGLIRNFQRFAWVITYLYGASPSLCSSFISHRKVSHKFEKIGKGTLYLPYATSLRMSDLGYTSSAQSSLKICYNDLDSYVSSLRKAIGLSATEYQHITSDEINGWNQLNSNVLQIENELYSPIRPKQVAKSLEMPSNALQDRGVSYIEVRSLDVNPYSPIGIDAHQFHFLDVFLLYCLLEPSAPFTDECIATNRKNITDTVLFGRDPNLTMNNGQKEVLLSEWGTSLSDKLLEVAKILDRANASDKYSKAIIDAKERFIQPELTLSGRWLGTLVDNQIDNSVLGLELAKEYKAHALRATYRHYNRQDFLNYALTSNTAREAIEKADKKTFSEFLENYFSTRVESDPNLLCD